MYTSGGTESEQYKKLFGFSFFEELSLASKIFKCTLSHPSLQGEFQYCQCYFTEKPCLDPHIKEYPYVQIKVTSKTSFIF